MRITAFFTNEVVTKENAETCATLYAMRWNAENLYQRLGKILGIIPSKDLYKRVLSYGFGLASMAIYGLQRAREFEEKRQGPELEDVELTRQRAWFSVARRDLESMLDLRPITVNR